MIADPVYSERLLRTTGRGTPSGHIIAKTPVTAAANRMYVCSLFPNREQTAHKRQDTFTGSSGAAGTRGPHQHEIWNGQAPPTLGDTKPAKHTGKQQHAPWQP